MDIKEIASFVGGIAVTGLSLWAKSVITSYRTGRKQGEEEGEKKLQLHEINTRLAAIESKVNHMEQQFTGFKQEVQADTNKRIDDYAAKVTKNIDEKMAAMQKGVDELKKSSEERAKVSSKTETDVAVVKERVTAVQAEIVSMKASIESSHRESMDLLQSVIARKATN